MLNIKFAPKVNDGEMVGTLHTIHSPSSSEISIWLTCTIAFADSLAPSSTIWSGNAKQTSEDGQLVFTNGR